MRRASPAIRFDMDAGTSPASIDLERTATGYAGIIFLEDQRMPLSCVRPVD